MSLLKTAFSYIFSLGARYQQAYGIDGSIGGAAFFDRIKGEEASTDAKAKTLQDKKTEATQEIGVQALTETYEQLPAGAERLQGMFKATPSAFAVTPPLKPQDPSQDSNAQGTNAQGTNAQASNSKPDAGAQWSDTSPLFNRVQFITNPDEEPLGHDEGAVGLSQGLTLRDMDVDPPGDKTPSGKPPSSIDRALYESYKSYISAKSPYRLDWSESKLEKGTQSCSARLNLTSTGIAALQKLTPGMTLRQLFESTAKSWTSNPSEQTAYVQQLAKWNNIELDREIGTGKSAVKLGDVSLSAINGNPSLYHVSLAERTDRTTGKTSPGGLIIAQYKVKPPSQEQLKQQGVNPAAIDSYIAQAVTKAPQGNKPGSQLLDQAQLEQVQSYYDQVWRGLVPTAAPSQIQYTQAINTNGIGKHYFSQLTNTYGAQALAPYIASNDKSKIAQLFPSSVQGGMQLTPNDVTSLNQKGIFNLSQLFAALIPADKTPAERQALFNTLCQLNHIPTDKAAATTALSQHIQSLSTVQFYYNGVQSQFEQTQQQAARAQKATPSVYTVTVTGSGVSAGQRGSVESIQAGVASEDAKKQALSQTQALARQDALCAELNQRCVAISQTNYAIPQASADGQPTQVNERAIALSRAPSAQAKAQLIKQFQNEDLKQAMDHYGPLIAATQTQITGKTSAQAKYEREVAAIFADVKAWTAAEQAAQNKLPEGDPRRGTLQTQEGRKLHDFLATTTQYQQSSQTLSWLHSNGTVDHFGTQISQDQSFSRWLVGAKPIQYALYTPDALPVNASEGQRSAHQAWTRLQEGTKDLNAEQLAQFNQAYSAALGDLSTRASGVMDAGIGAFKWLEASAAGATAPVTAGGGAALAVWLATSGSEDILIGLDKMVFGAQASVLRPTGQLMRYVTNAAYGVFERDGGELMSAQEADKYATIASMLTVAGGSLIKSGALLKSTAQAGQLVSTQGLGQIVGAAMSLDFAQSTLSGFNLASYGIEHALQAGTGISEEEAQTATTMIWGMSMLKGLSGIQGQHQELQKQKALVAQQTDYTNYIEQLSTAAQTDRILKSYIGLLETGAMPMDFAWIESKFGIAAPQSVKAYHQLVVEQTQALNEAYQEEVKLLKVSHEQLGVVSQNLSDIMDKGTASVKVDDLLKEIRDIDAQLLAIPDASIETLGKLNARMTDVLAKVEARLAGKDYQAIKSRIQASATKIYGAIEAYAKAPIKSSGNTYAAPGITPESIQAVTKLLAKGTVLTVESVSNLSAKAKALYEQLKSVGADEVKMTQALEAAAKAEPEAARELVAGLGVNAVGVDEAVSKPRKARRVKTVDELLVNADGVIADMTTPEHCRIAKQALKADIPHYEAIAQALPKGSTERAEADARVQGLKAFSAKVEALRLALLGHRAPLNWAQMYKDKNLQPLIDKHTSSETVDGKTVTKFNAKAYVTEIQARISSCNSNKNATIWGADPKDEEAFYQAEIQKQNVIRGTIIQLNWEQMYLDKNLQPLIDKHTSSETVNGKTVTKFDAKAYVTEIQVRISGCNNLKSFYTWGADAKGEQAFYQAEIQKQNIIRGTIIQLNWEQMYLDKNLQPLIDKHTSSKTVDGKTVTKFEAKAYVKEIQARISDCNRPNATPKWGADPKGEQAFFEGEINKYQIAQGFTIALNWEKMYLDKNVQPLIDKYTSSELVNGKTVTKFNAKAYIEDIQRRINSCNDLKKEAKWGADPEGEKEFYKAEIKKHQIALGVVIPLNWEKMYLDKNVQPLIDKYTSSELVNGKTVTKFDAKACVKGIEARVRECNNLNRKSSKWGSDPVGEQAFYEAEIQKYAGANNNALATKQLKDLQKQEAAIQKQVTRLSRAIKADITDEQSDFSALRLAESMLRDVRRDIARVKAELAPHAAAQAQSAYSQRMQTQTEVGQMGMVERFIGHLGATPNPRLIDAFMERYADTLTPGAKAMLEKAKQDTQPTTAPKDSPAPATIAPKDSPAPATIAPKDSPAPDVSWDVTRSQILAITDPQDLALTLHDLQNELKANGNLDEPAWAELMSDLETRYRAQGDASTLSLMGEFGLIDYPPSTTVDALFVTALPIEAQLRLDNGHIKVMVMDASGELQPMGIGQMEKALKDQGLSDAALKPFKEWVRSLTTKAKFMAPDQSAKVTIPMTFAHAEGQHLFALDVHGEPLALSLETGPSAKKANDIDQVIRGSKVLTDAYALTGLPQSNVALTYKAPDLNRRDVYGPDRVFESVLAHAFNHTDMVEGKPRHSIFMSFEKKTQTPMTKEQVSEMILLADAIAQIKQLKQPGEAVDVPMGQPVGERSTNGVLDQKQCRAIRLVYLPDGSLYNAYPVPIK